MTDIQIATWLAIVLVVELIAVVVAFVFVFARENNLHIVQKIGFALMVFGILVQIVRSLHYLDTGSYPIDKIFPMWITKDIGACVLIYYYAFVYPKRDIK